MLEELERLWVSQMAGKIYTPEQRKFFEEFIPGHHHIETMEEFNKRFYPQRIRENQVKAYAKNHGIKTGFTGRFEKGNYHGIPIKPGQRISKATEFKKGQLGWNHKPVGTITIRHNWRHGGVAETWIKVEEPKKWELYNRYLWKKHYGEIPSGYVVAFRNGDPLDCRIENLRLVSKSAMQMASIINEPELRDVALSIGEIRATINRRKNNGKGKI